MLTQEEVELIVKRAFKTFRSVDQSMLKALAQVGLSKEPETLLPPYYPYYKEIVENVNSIMTHAVKGHYPKELFQNPAPNQTDVESDYLKNNYKQTTLPIYIDYKNTILRAFNDNNWDIDYNKDEESEEEKETFRLYVEQDLPKYGSLESFIKNILVNMKSLDAMAVVCIKPYEVRLRMDGEEVVVDDSYKIEPCPYIYTCKQVVDYSEGKYYCIELGETSWVEYAGKRQKIGRVYEIYDDENIYKAVQVGKYIDGVFEISLYYQHNYGKVPVRRLEGVPMYDTEGEQIIHLSPFLFAVDILDLALLNSQYLQISINYCTFPYRVMIGDVCEFTDSNGNACEQGQIPQPDQKGYYKCPACDGVGLRSRVSRMGTLLLRPQKKTDEGDVNLKADPMKYISPSTETLEFVKTKIEEDEKKARKILHLRDSDTQVKFNEDTATASNNDLKSTYAFIKPISDQVFSLYEFCLHCIGWMRYGESFEAPKLTYPKTFDFATEADYLAEINNSVKVGLAPSFIQQILMRYIRAMYSDDEESAKIFNLIVSSDRLLTLSNGDISLKLSKGTVTRWEEILHTSALTLVQELLRADEGLLELDLSIQIQKLQDLAKAKEAEATKAEQEIQKNLIDKLGATNTD
jgi:hypothetical protein